jgi:xylan 1,4-beta-xylosidase
VDSSRIVFRALRGAAARFSGSPAFRYKIEASSHGKQFIPLLDKTNNTITSYTEFDELPPTRCRFIRLVLTDWPRSVDQPLGITEFTIFGKYVKPGGKLSL